MERFARSWDLIKACFGVLRDDKELLLFPILSGIAAIMVLATFALPLVFARVFDNGLMPFNLIVGFLFYLCQYAVIFFFNSALVGAALIRLRGGSPSFSDGIAVARQHIGPILGYAAIAATVGVLLKMKGKRSGFVADAVRSIAGMAWTLSTFLVVPVLVSQKLGPIDAIKESADTAEENLGREPDRHGRLVARLRHHQLPLCTGIAGRGIRRVIGFHRFCHRLGRCAGDRPAADRYRQNGDFGHLRRRAVPLCRRRAGAGRL